MERICNCCNISKPISDFRDNRKKCKLCDNKRRYIQKMERRRNDPEYHKELKAYDVKRKRRKENSNPMAKCIQINRVCIRGAFKRKGYSKNSQAYKLLGASWEVVIAHFESLFQDGMTWDNHGEWEIDHTIPISTANSEEEVIKLCYYKNLQPLWKEENRAKSNKIL